MRNPNGEYGFRNCKCIKCGNMDIIEWALAVPSGLIIEPDEPCHACGETSAYIGPVAEMKATPRLETYFNRDDVLIH